MLVAGLKARQAAVLVQHGLLVACRRSQQEPHIALGTARQALHRRGLIVSDTCLPLNPRSMSQAMHDLHGAPQHASRLH